MLLLLFVLCVVCCLFCACRLHADFPQYTLTHSWCVVKYHHTHKHSLIRIEFWIHPTTYAFMCRRFIKFCGDGLRNGWKCILYIRHIVGGFIQYEMFSLLLPLQLSRTRYSAQFLTKFSIRITWWPRFVDWSQFSKINDYRSQINRNSNRFQKACTLYGVPDVDLFQTTDLWDFKNIALVTQTIFAIGRAVSS